MSAVLDYPQRHVITAHEYMRMGEISVFEPDARLELIEGEIVDRAPIDPPHSGIVKALIRLFSRRAGDQALLSVQDPVIVSDFSAPQPDVALLKPRDDDYSQSHPTAKDILLLVEVSDTTLPYDLKTKVPLYARCGIIETWIVDVNARAIRAFRDPGATGYTASFTATGDDTVASIALPDASIALRELFPR